MLHCRVSNLQQQFICSAAIIKREILNKLRAHEAASKLILADIVGRRTGAIKENGLIDSECVLCHVEI